jgi:hypothetical protein
VVLGYRPEPGHHRTSPEFFRRLDGPPTPEQLAEMAAPHECDAHPEGTQRIVERHGPRF